MKAGGLMVAVALVVAGCGAGMDRVRARVAATEAQPAPEVRRATSVEPRTGSLLEEYEYYVVPDQSGGSRLVMHGRYRAYHEAGGPRVTGEYKDGKLDGTWLTISDQGEVTTVWKYADGRRLEAMDCTRGECGDQAKGTR